MTKQELLKIAKPILFNTEMVRAILDGRKTVTWRAIKFPEGMTGRLSESGAADHIFYPGGKIPRYSVGDILYVRGTWCTDEDMADVFEKNLTHGFYYRANEIKKEWVNDRDIVTWRPSIHMPKTAARIFLKVTDVRVERLQDITPLQAKAEGIVCDCLECVPYVTENICFKSYVGHFQDLWNSTIKKQDIDKYSWQANPWVWVYEFERIEI